MNYFLQTTKPTLQISNPTQHAPEQSKQEQGTYLNTNNQQQIQDQNILTITKLQFQQEQNKYQEIVSNIRVLQQKQNVLKKQLEEHKSKFLQNQSPQIRHNQIFQTKPQINVLAQENNEQDNQLILQKNMQQHLQYIEKLTISKQRELYAVQNRINLYSQQIQQQEKILLMQPKDKTKICQQQVAQMYYQPNYNQVQSRNQYQTKELINQQINNEALQQKLPEDKKDYFYFQNNHKSQNLSKNEAIIQKNSVPLVNHPLICQQEQQQSNHYKLSQQKNGLIADKYDEKRQVQYPTEVPENSKLDSVCFGLPNNNQSSYFNSSLQALKQIYFYDRDFFKNSSFGNCLYTLFKKMEDQKQVDNDILEEIFRVSNDYQIHISNEGDSYLTLFCLLEKLCSQMRNDEEKQLFDEFFTTKLEHQLYCAKCDQELQNSDSILAYYYEEHFSFEHKQLNHIFPPVSFMLCEEEIQCPFPSCRKRNIPSSKILYLTAPKFVFVKVAQNSTSDFQYAKKQITLDVEGQSEKFYNLIGFCNYYSTHHTYTAKYDNQWIEFNDTHTKIVDQPSTTNSIYYLLQRVD